MAYVAVGGCACPEKLAPLLRTLQSETGCTYNSIYRGQDAYELLHSLGKSTQSEIHAKYPSISNPPGRSTHELRSDGVAYAGPIGRVLDWWQCGVDVNDSDVSRVITAARTHGWIVFQPYHAGVEFHHLNFAKQPFLFIVLQKGAVGIRVWYLTKRLKRLHFLRNRYWRFTWRVSRALKNYQASRGLISDGIYGPHTAAQLAADYRRATQ